MRENGVREPRAPPSQVSGEAGAAGAGGHLQTQHSAFADGGKGVAAHFVGIISDAGRDWIAAVRSFGRVRQQLFFERLLQPACYSPPAMSPSANANSIAATTRCSARSVVFFSRRLPIQAPANAASTAQASRR